MPKHPFQLIFILDKFLLKIENFLLVFCVITLLFFAFLQVVLRNIFDTGISWADVFNRLLVLWIGMLAATIGAREGRHLTLEVLTKFLPQKLKPIANLFVNLFVITVSFLLAQVSFLFFSDQLLFESAEVLFAGVPIAYFSVIFPVGFGLICFRYVVKLMEDLLIFSGIKR